MKKLILASLLASVAFASELYSAKVINLYLHPNDTKPSGKLLPTNAFKVLSNKDGFSKIQISGLYNPTKGKALYVTNHNRILVAAFAKQSNVKFSAQKPNAFTKANVQVYAKSEDLKDASAKLEPLFAKAKELFGQNCGSCHALHNTKEFSANQWPSNFKAMQSRSAIEKEDAWLVIQYLQKHAKDMK